MRTRNRWIAGAAVVAFATGASAGSPSDWCDVRLSVQLTPDAAVPRDAGFLSSLVADPQYQLRWIKGDDTAALLEMIGPATDDQCSEGVNRLSRSSHVLEVQVVQAGDAEQTALL